MVSLSAAVGYILYSGALNPGIIKPTLGVLLLSCGSSALNQYQERDIDVLMYRTRLRPLPAQQITPKAVLINSGVFLIIGNVVLFLIAHKLALALGVFNVLWYNAVYTPLKRKTSSAVIIGAIIGAVPPAIGWISAGGSLLELPILGIMLFFFLWQIPHFWLLLIRSGDEYVNAGLPSITSKFNTGALGLFIFSGMLAAVIMALLTPLFGITFSRNSYIVLALVSIWFVGHSTFLLLRKNPSAFSKYSFGNINIFAFLVMAILTSQKLI